MQPQAFEPIYPNPYIAGNPIRNREMFFGREDEFRFIARVRRRAQNRHLGPFKLDEAKQFIAESSARAGKPLAEHTDFVLELAGHFPIFIQMVCAVLFSAETREKIAYKKMKEAFLEEAQPHFQEYWEKFEESGKAVVIALARNKKPPREHAFALKDLAQAGFVLNGKLFSAVFAEFVREAERRPGRWWQRWG